MNKLFSKDYIQFVDLESTGFSSYRNSIIALASIIVDRKTNEIVDEFLEYGKPESSFHWSEKAEEVHGISLSKAMGFQPQGHLALKYLKFLKPYKHEDNHPLEFWYHGRGKFDYRFAEAMMCKQGLRFSWNKIADTSLVNSTADLAKKQMCLKNYKLNTVCDALKIELDHHKAESDARACYEIFKKLGDTSGRLDQITQID